MQQYCFCESSFHFHCLNKPKCKMAVVFSLIFDSMTVLACRFNKMFTFLSNLDLKCRCICGNCVPMQTGRESVCCRENSKCCDKIPSSMSCITDNENFTAVCTNAAVIETAFNQYLENEGPIDDEPLNEYVCL